MLIFLRTMYTSVNIIIYNSSTYVNNYDEAVLKPKCYLYFQINKMYLSYFMSHDNSTSCRLRTTSISRPMTQKYLY